MVVAQLGDMTVADMVLRVQFLVIYLVCAFHFVGEIDWRVLCAWSRFKRACADRRTQLVLYIRRMFEIQAGEVDRAIQQQMEEFRLDQSRRMMVHALNFVSPIFLLSAVFEEMHGHARDWGDVLVWAGASLVLVLSYAVTRGYLALTIRKFDVAYALVSLSLTARLLFMVEDPHFFERQNIRLLTRILLSLLYLDFWKALPWHIIYSGMTCFCYARNSAAILKSADNGELTFMADEFIAFLCTVSCCYIVEHWLQQRFRVQIIAENQQRASSKLAAYHCDAVFWLTPELLLREPAPHLAHMLFLGHAENHLQGRRFENFIATDSDRDRFRDFVDASSSCSEPQGLPALLHMHMRDCTSRTFPVEVFHSCFVDFNNQTGHFVGIRETPEHAYPVQRREPEGQAGAVVNSEAPAQRPMNRSFDSESEAGSDAGSHTSAGEPQPFAPLLQDEGAGDAARVLLDSITCEMKGCSVDFTSLTGPLFFNTSFYDLINGRPQRQAFESWLQDQVNDVIRTAAIGTVPFDLNLSCPALGRNRKTRKVEIHATGFVTQGRLNARISEMGVEVLGDCTDELHNILCTLELTNVQLHRPERQQRPRRVEPVNTAPAQNLLNRSQELSSFDNESEAGSDAGSHTSAGVPQPFAPALRDEGAREAARVLLDAVTLKMKACSVGFTSFTGPLFFNTPFIDLIADRRQRTAFSRWLQAQVNDILRTDSLGIVPFDLNLSRHVLGRDRKTRKVEIHARGYVTQARQNAQISEMGVEVLGDCSDEIHDILCILELTSVQLHRPGQQQRPRQMEPVSTAQIDMPAQHTSHPDGGNAEPAHAVQIDMLAEHTSGPEIGNAEPVDAAPTGMTTGSTSDRSGRLAALVSSVPIGRPQQLSL